VKPDLRTFVRSRLEELEGEIAAIEERLPPLYAERADLLRVITALDGDDRLRARARRTPLVGREHTIKEMAVSVLQGRPSGAGVRAIIDDIEKRFGVQIPRTSLSPQLSRLGQDGVIVQNGREWKIVSRAAVLSGEPALSN
jgi:hypothetical protein